MNVEQEAIHKLELDLYYAKASMELDAKLLRKRRLTEKLDEQLETVIKNQVTELEAGVGVIEKKLEIVRMGKEWTP